MSESEIKILQRIDSKLTKLLNQPKEERWITGKWLTILTGWDHRGKRNARQNGIVKYKKENGSYLYLLSSIPNEFKKIA